MPTRLLEPVPRDGDIYLLDPQADASYVALGHCWAQSGTPVTPTTQTLRARMEGVDIIGLPRTLRGSVESLGLWVGSLCISQDDADAWPREDGDVISQEGG